MFFKTLIPELFLNYINFICVLYYIKNTHFYKLFFFKISMITTLEELVFGLNSYEKVKIEDRYEQIHSILLSSHPSLHISTIDEFDALEQCLFKIQDQLRVKSSNLNSIIKKPNSLSKEKIETIIKLLKSKREEILNYAFTSVSKPTSTTISNNTEETQVEVEENNEDISTFSSNNFETKTQIENNKPKDLDLENTTKSSNEVTKKQYRVEEKNSPEDSISEKKNSPQFEISNTGKIGIYLNSNSKKLNLITAKSLLEKLYSTHLYNATLLYVESTNTNSLNLICLGVSSHDTLNIPLLQRTQYREENLQEVYETITTHKNSNASVDVEVKEVEDKASNKYKNISKSKDLEEEKEVKDSASNEEDSTNYLSIDNEVKNVETHKYEEDSLEKLVLSHEDSEKYTRGINHNKVDESFKFEKGDDSIVVEKKETFGVKEDDEKKKNAQEDEKIKTYSTNSEDEPNSTDHLITNENFSKDNSENTAPQALITRSSYEIYGDDIISISVNENGTIRSQLSVSFTNNQDLLYQQPNAIAHAILFSKHFLASMFETIQSDATMLVTSLFSNSFQLLPRFQNDNVFSLGGQSISEEELNATQRQIESKLIEELESQQPPTPAQATNEKKETPSSNYKENSSSEKNSNNDSSKKRAKYLLSSLRRLG